jgi:hypothetical protein
LKLELDDQERRAVAKSLVDRKALLIENAGDTTKPARRSGLLELKAIALLPMRSPPRLAAAKRQSATFVRNSFWVPKRTNQRPPTPSTSSRQSTTSGNSRRRPPGPSISATGSLQQERSYPNRFAVTAFRYVQYAHRPAVPARLGERVISVSLLMGWTAPRTASSVPRWLSLKVPSGREAVRGQVYHRYLVCHARRA